MSELENESAQNVAQMTVVNVDTKDAMLDDLERAVSLTKQLKAVLAGAHPNVVKLVRKLLF